MGTRVRGCIKIGGPGGVCSFHTWLPTLAFDSSSVDCIALFCLAMSVMHLGLNLEPKLHALMVQSETGYLADMMIYCYDTTC